ncbi:MAG: hypothetical protein K2W96_16020 [Gemmataceae bacterium]|nr:hypothetical protein [Gemmataceae bacterium]
MLSAILLLALAADKPAIYGPYFESNKSGLKGEASYLVFTDAKRFGEVLRPLPPVGKRRTVAVPDAAWKESLALVVIRRGATPFTYALDSVEEKDGTLVCKFTSRADGKPGTATFASPFVVAVPKGKAKEVRFVENGKEAEKVEVGE